MLVIVEQVDIFDKGLPALTDGTRDLGCLADFFFIFSPSVSSITDSVVEIWLIFFRNIG